MWMQSIHIAIYRSMSKNIQIRDVPDDVHARLRARAAEAGMSMSDYLRQELGHVAARTSMEEILTRAAQRPGNIPFGVATRHVRAMRDDDRD
jgi:plasmid stability protein